MQWNDAPCGRDDDPMTTNRPICFALLGLVLALAGPTVSRAQNLPLVVNSTSDAKDRSPDDGVCLTAGEVCTLRAAVEQANQNAGLDRIILDPPGRLYRLTLSQPIDVRSDIIVESSACPEAPGGTDPCPEPVGDVDHVCPIDRQTKIQVQLDKPSRVFDVAPEGSLTLRGVTLENGTAGATCIESAGGAICNQGTLRLEGVVIRTSAANRGGAIYGPATLCNSIIEENKATEAGGGIATLSGTLWLGRVTIAQNEASGDGGGLWLGSTLDVRRTTLERNTAQRGGGIWVSGTSTAHVETSTLSDNTASDSERGGGGGIEVSCTACTLNLVHVTITANHGVPGGIKVASPSPPTAVHMLSSILAENDGDACQGPVISDGHNLLGGEGECNYTEGTGDVREDEPSLAAFVDDLDRPGSGWHLPLSNSPALDAADQTHCPATDQRGQTRVCDESAPANPCDIGAAERIPDSDEDGFNDCIDVCPDVSDPEQTDSDGDYIGDACDNQDTDEDGVRDGCDRCLEGTVPLVLPSGTKVTFPNGCDPIQQCPCELRPPRQRSARKPNCRLDVGPFDDGGSEPGAYPWRSTKEWEKCVARATKPNRALILPVTEGRNCKLTGRSPSPEEKRILRDALITLRDSIEATPDCPAPPKEGDPDRDGITESEGDNCPTVYNPRQTNTDQDWADVEFCTEEREEHDPCKPKRWFADELGDWCDDDDDGDRIPDTRDHCRRVPSVDNWNNDKDGCGDACDSDIDGDRIKNEEDRCPRDPSKGCRLSSTTTVNTTSTATITVTSSTAP